MAIKASYKICLDIGGTKVLGVIFDEKDQIIYRLKKKTKEGGDSTANVEQVITATIDEMLEASKIDLKDVQAISAGAPGVIDTEKGIIFFSPNLPWRNYNIKKPMEKKYGVPFYIGNDVNIGVLGEHRYGVAKGYHNVVGFFVGTGMGGGLILNDELYTGNKFKAAEYGHMILDEKGPKCNCGQRGCLEAFASKKGMTAYILKQADKGHKSVLLPDIENGVFKSKKLKKALENHDKVAMKAVDRACHYLAIASGNMINTFSPDMIVYGGGVIEALGDLFLGKILKEVDHYCMPSIRNTVTLKTAALGDDSIVYGALAMIKMHKKVVKKTSSKSKTQKRS